MSRFEGPITPFMGPWKEGTRILHFVKPSTNLSKDMRALNRPNLNWCNGLTGNGGSPRGAQAGSALERNATRLPRAAIAVLLLLFALATPTAGQVAAGGIMRFATDEVAFIGGFAGVAADVWLIEPFGYLSHDAGVWAIQAGASVPVVRLETVRVSIRLGTSTAIAGPAVEPNIHPTIGAGVRIGRRFGVLAEVDRARAFTLLRGGLFVGW